MYSEVHIAPEINLAIQQKLRKAERTRPALRILGDLGSCPNRDPELFGKLKAADREAEDRQADEREPKQLTLAEHMVLFAKLQGPKKVEATQQEGFVCVGGFSNPLF
jgi:hypothetical protein